MKKSFKALKCSFSTECSLSSFLTPSFFVGIIEKLGKVEPAKKLGIPIKYFFIPQ